jgi:cytochrome c oxidase subunit 2
MKHFVAVVILVILSTLLVKTGLDAVGLLPVEASAQSVPIDRLFNLHFWLISFLFSLIVVFMLYSIVVFRRKPGETGEGKHFEGNTRLEIFWTLVPLATVLYIAYVGAGTLAETRRIDPQAMVVKVTAGQWFWKFEYPDLGVTSTTLNLPVNQQILLQMQSQDVIHSFWVPEFRVKQDVLPGRTTELRVTPTMMGNYKVRCAELCGTSHALMENPVTVMAGADFKTWAADQQKTATANPAERGKKWATENGCVACHSADGTQVVGPTWKGLYGSDVALADGATVKADDAYLKESILNPNAKIVKGFQPNIMPQNFREKLSDDQINDIIEYIKSLK